MVRDVSLMKNVVIDAGGGVVMDSENMKNLKRQGTVICLWAEPEVILARTKRYTHRPLLNVENPLDKIKELLTGRKPFYERADYQVHTSGLPVEEVRRKIERIIKSAKF